MVLAAYFIIAAAGFLVGSFPTGYLIANAYGVDIRSAGSHNIGATNVIRSVNPWAGRVVFVVDVIKAL
jgi:glycerol-3-phosphate acyltransferase PlsY